MITVSNVGLPSYLIGAVCVGQSQVGLTMPLPMPLAGR